MNYIFFITFHLFIKIKFKLLRNIYISFSVVLKSQNYLKTEKNISFQFSCNFLLIRVSLSLHLCRIFCKMAKIIFYYRSSFSMKQNQRWIYIVKKIFKKIVIRKYSKKKHFQKKNGIILKKDQNREKIHAKPYKYSAKDNTDFFGCST